MDIFNNHLSDDDEEIIEFINYERREYVVQERVDYFHSLDDLNFFTRFRLKKETILRILQLIEAQIETVTDRNHSIKPIDQLLLALRYYSTGCMLLTVADFLHVSKSSASNIIKKVSIALASLSRHFIKMPTTNLEIIEAQSKFYEKARFPRVIGSIYCTHVKIQSPGGEQPEVFRNRKGYFSINVQTISSTDLKILDIVARWPGSCHDQTIFNNSLIKRRLEANEFNNSLNVADSGYANSKYIVTPLLNVNNPVEELYNESVTRTRNPVERQYGVWKRRFPVLSVGMRLKLDTVLTVIIAVAVLNNIAIEENEDRPPEELNLNIDFNYDEEINIDPVEIPPNMDNARDLLLVDYFPALLRIN